MTIRRRTLHLPALLIAAAVFVAWAAVLAVSRETEATFAGKNGKIAYADFGGGLYAINPNGSAKTKVTNTRAGGIPIDYSPDGKQIAYTAYGARGLGPDSEIFTINVGGGG